MDNLKDFLAQHGGVATDSLSHISEKPWSDYTEADYSLEQWHAACLIHQHEGGTYTKNDCKLPVRTPAGALNRAGVHAAASALAGARGGVKATREEMATAARELFKCYKELGEKAPFSLFHYDDMVSEELDEFLAHFGAKGMKWGVRKSDASGASGGTFVKAKRRTVPILGDQGDVKGVMAKAKGYGSMALGGKVAVKAGQAGAAATVAATKTGTIATAAGHVVVVSNTGFALALGSVGAGALASIPASMATKAYFQPLSTAYHTSKGDIRKGTKALNAEFSAVGHNLKTNTKLQSSYNKRYIDIVRSSLNQSKSGWTHPFRALAEHRVGKTSRNEYRLDFKLDPKGSKKPYVTVHGPKRFTNDLKLGSFKHADPSDDLITSYDVEITYDSDGFVQDFSIPDLEDLNFEIITHQDKLDEFLAHHGIKGMRWGVISGALGTGARATGRAALATGRAAAATGRGIGTTKRAIGKVRVAVGGPSNDALRAKATAKAIKRGGLLNASDADLNHLVNRLNLEQRYSDIDKSRVGSVNKTAKRLLSYGATFNSALKFSHSEGGRVLESKIFGPSGGKHLKGVPKIKK